MQIYCLMRTDGFHMDLHTQLRFSSRMELSGVSDSFVRLYDAIIVPLRAINLVVMIITACKRYTYTYSITFINAQVSIASINPFYSGAIPFFIFLLVIYCNAIYTINSFELCSFKSLNSKNTYFLFVIFLA